MKAWRVTSRLINQTWHVAGSSREQVSITLARSAVEYLGCTYKEAFVGMDIVRAASLDQRTVGMKPGMTISDSSQGGER